MFNKKELQEQNEALKKLAAEREETILKLEGACSEHSSANIRIEAELTRERASRRESEAENRKTQQQIKDLEKQLDNLSNVKTVIAELQKHIGTSNKLMEDKANTLQAEFSSLKIENGQLKDENHRLMHEFERIGYLHGKVEAYERMPMLNTMLCRSACEENRTVQI